MNGRVVATNAMCMGLGHNFVIFSHVLVIHHFTNFSIFLKRNSKNDKVMTSLENLGIRESPNQ